MVKGPTRHQQVFIVSGISITLYSTVAIISFYYFLKFFRIVNNTAKDTTKPPNYLQSIGRFDEVKRNFFLILFISSCLEVPLYIGCLVVDGASECDWPSPSALVFWFFHLIALCGFIVCIIIPCVLWSDMINKKDGKLINSSFPYDPIKQFFRLSIVLYSLNIFINMLVCCIYYRLSDRNNYEDAPTYTICALIESILSVFIAIGCFYCAFKLQSYVIQAKLRINVELKFLFTLNILLFIILLALLGRGIVILGISAFDPATFNSGLSYTIFTLISRWLPDVFCQLSLIYIMRYSGEEILRKNVGNTAIVHDSHSDGTPSHGKSTLLRAMTVSVDNDIHLQFPELEGTANDVTAPVEIIAKALPDRTIETLQAQGRAYRIDSDESPRVASTYSSPYDLSSYLTSRRFLESNDVENPISYLVRVENRSDTATSLSRHETLFSTDSSPSRGRDFPTSLDDDTL